MMPKDGQFFCRKCQAFRGGAQQQSMMVQAGPTEKHKEITIIEEVRDILPRTQDVECPKCATRDAWWFLRQTRKADEAETMFLECVKCRHRWRRY
jgi:DNA-directed RNA polymerase subunit M